MLILKYLDKSFYIMTDKEISDEELDAELDKAFKANEAKRDHCGTMIPSNKEIGIQRDNVKLKKD